MVGTSGKPVTRSSAVFCRIDIREGERVLEDHCPADLEAP